ncbi:GntR family transcriptional regulator [Burkholderia vietnamiensis]|uniref:Transcriptional regulator, GntR family n=2 Tax=Burkholderia vietnamiensis TaxID=60552 RepID=A4JT66_BURVG|nr:MULTISPECIES: GntR family transcriptional regulator [Burkholderia]ABO59469.1 transcriptional regulator, GntR family [Burkholderia vietnamiensis G4]AFJ90309.1 Putative regulator PutR for proline utilization, GntR family [Burkholderia sp. KJ006]AJY08645.1 bacterial regulatory s, gntR family protein [Burkholderia vietnamiensis LMG 10929]AOK02709.1 GntR family transcriptional regulator [Burkholderia vietnamiensis]AOK45147.1 GntR family transcriptional regulator [Burkholderia vietnamiensis]
MNDKRPALVYATRAEAAANELRRRILTGEYVDGYQLRQDALATELGISRIPLREALVQLESEGLVKILPHKGAIVSELSPEDITELFELRALLEPVLLKKSIPKLTAEDFARLDAILDEYSAVLHASQSGRWGELNTELHQLLLSRAEQPKTAAIVASLLQQTDRYTRVQLSLSEAARDVAESEHAELVALCRKGDGRAAASLLKRHIEHAGGELNAFLRERRLGR